MYELPGDLIECRLPISRSEVHMSEKLPSDDGNATDLGTGLSSMPTSQSP